MLWTALPILLLRANVLPFAQVETLPLSDPFSTWLLPLRATSRRRS